MADEASPHPQPLRAPRAEVPSWVTEELLNETIRIWSKRYGFLIGSNEALGIILRVGTLVDVLLSEER